MRFGCLRLSAPLSRSRSRSLWSPKAYGTAILRDQTDQTMMQTVYAPFLGASSRARVVTFLIGHTWDLYGQLAVYLRLQGHVPPASQRP